jgi:hypothetical protein
MGPPKSIVEQIAYRGCHRVSHLRAKRRGPVRPEDVFGGTPNSTREPDVRLTLRGQAADGEDTVATTHGATERRHPSVRRSPFQPIDVPMTSVWDDHRKLTESLVRPLPISYRRDNDSSR